MNYVKVKITGLNLTRLIDKLVARGICLDEVKIKTNSVLFKINELDLKVLRDVCKKEHKTFSIYYSSGIKNFFRKLPYCFGIVLAGIIAFCYLFSFDIFVRKVDARYISNTSYDMSKVEKVLKDNGIKSGVRKSQINVKEIERILLSNVDDISGCTAKLSGGNLDIFVYPATKNHEINKENLYSKYDGVVTKVELTLGKSNFKPGDIVKKGDLVIESDDGAEGKVFAKVYFIGTAIYNQKQIEKQKTGNYEIFRDYSIFTKKFIKQPKKCRFAEYLVKKCDFYISDNYFLPILCEEFLFEEVRLVEKIIPFSSVENDIKKQAYELALNKIENSNEVKSVTYSIVEEGDYTRVDCYAECEIDILK